MKYKDFIAIVEKYHSGEYAFSNADRMGLNTSPHPDEHIQSIEGSICINGSWDWQPIFCFGLHLNKPEDIEEHVRRQIMKPDSVDRILVLKDVIHDIKEYAYGVITLQYDALSAVSKKLDSVEITWKSSKGHYRSSSYELKNGVVRGIPITKQSKYFTMDHDFYKSPYNQHLWNEIEFMSSKPVYKGANLTVYSPEIWFINMGTFCMPTTQKWVNNTLHTFPDYIKEEIKMYLSMHA
ncbi:hypothetical protein D3C78_20430 [compost metagenome]